MIEIEQARELLAKAVETQGRDFVYNPGGNDDCEYWPIPATSDNPDDPRTKTGCLIGVVLQMVGERRHLDIGSSYTIARLADIELGGLMSPETVDYFAVAQSAQDGGESWGYAYDRAEELYRQRLAG